MKPESAPDLLAYSASPLAPVLWETVSVSLTAFASVATLTVTFCGVSQFPFVNVMLEGLKERRAPDGVTVTLADGCEPRLRA